MKLGNMKKLFFTAIIMAVTIVFSGCSEPDAPEVKVQQNAPVLTGKIRCPKCRKNLQKEEIIPEKAPLARCKLCWKLSPAMRFYPDAKIPKKSKKR